MRCSLNKGLIMMETIISPANTNDKIEQLGQLTAPTPNDSEGKNDPIPSPLRTPNDKTLLSAWKRLIQLDGASFRQKQNHVRLRAIVILFSFLSSFLAVAGAATA